MNHTKISGEVSIKSTKWDKIVKTIPVIISIVAIILSGFSLYLGRASTKDQQELVAAINRPYLDGWFNSDIDDDEGLGWFVYNAGNGPAIISSLAMDSKSDEFDLNGMEFDKALEKIKTIILENDILSKYKIEWNIDGIYKEMAISPGARHNLLYLRRSHLNGFNKHHLEIITNEISKIADKIIMKIGFVSVVDVKHTKDGLNIDTENQRVFLIEHDHGEGS